ncbi:3-ketoacyl-CoA thiolase 2 [Pyrus ussuriensis x Pyrus communis]|uniref:3-ketoacyl-CoA thiolase 2 n=1 Tax=Pyrus ussuriensis x Pyrus communis TaxID=2448454 RepID=A0A5N5FBX0_9ROSA|nr:3-ketoacyl-CoA thiolase 2 [Pyrus ussuriensis x Pyrus communis]
MRISGSKALFDWARPFCKEGELPMYHPHICTLQGVKDIKFTKLILPVVLQAVVEKTKVSPREIGDIIVGTVLAPGSQRASECRMAAFYAGILETVPIRTVNRQCSYGLQAIDDVAASIRAGFYDIAGLESMAANPMAWEGSVNPNVKMFEQAQNCLLPMGITPQKMSRINLEFHGRSKIRQQLVDSHRKATAATAAGKFKDNYSRGNQGNIHPLCEVATSIPRKYFNKTVTISVHDGIWNTTLADLAKLKPVFKKDGSTIAWYLLTDDTTIHLRSNSSQASDGARAVLLMKRSVVEQKGLPILGVFSWGNLIFLSNLLFLPGEIKICGVHVPLIFQQAGSEVVPAFASQYLYCRNKLGLDSEKINVNGGTLAIGHPLGATGKDCRFGVISMCGQQLFSNGGDCVDGLCNARKVESHNHLLSKDAL